MDSQLNSKLDSLIKNAITNIPFYKEYFRGKQPVLDDFPILKKDFIRDNFNKFKSENTLEKDYLVEVTTGSTGLPFRCLKTAQEMFISQKKLWKCRDLWLPEILTKRLLTFSNSFSLESQVNSADLPKTAAQAPTYNAYYGSLDLRFITPHDLNNIPVSELISFIKRAAPDWIRATPSNIYEFCVRVNQASSSTKKLFPSVKFVEVSGETLDEGDRVLIETTFACKVANHYGAREIWPIAYECHHNSLHIVEDHVYCEVGKAAYGNAGELYITALNQKSFPFIRYAIQDLGIVSYAKCPCGKSGLIIKALKGRVANLIEIDGARYNVQIFSQLIKEMVRTGLIDSNNFWVTRKSKYMFEFQFEKLKTYTPGLNEFIANYLARHLHKKVAFTIRLSDSIPSIPREKKSFYSTEYKS